MTATRSSQRAPTFDRPVAGREKPRSRKKTWGIFYTPRALIDCLTEWAIRSADESILEPSFGGCGFLDACANKLKSLNVSQPWPQMCGCDIDRGAFKNLPPAFKNPDLNTRFLHKNFLATEPTHYPISKFSIVIGNPPYVSRHNMCDYQLRTARHAAKICGIHLGGHASLWAFFVMHSLRFLAEDGRMAWVLPRTLSQGGYGRDLLAALSTRFRDIQVLSLRDRAFVTAGAEELIDILLCDGFSSLSDYSTPPIFRFVENLPWSGTELIRTRGERRGSITSFNARFDALLPEHQASIDASRLVFCPRPISEFAVAKIGIVTGATKFFVLKASELETAYIPRKACSFVLTKSRLAAGIRITAVDAESIISANHRVLLVKHSAPEAQSYWATMPKSIREGIETFKKRQQWNAADDGNIPDGFFPPLCDATARLLLNEAGVNSTNTVHRVYFHKNVTPQMRIALAVLFFTHAVQLSCELTGRQCGSGGLKFEPSDFLKIEVPMLTSQHIESAPDALHTLDLAFRSGNASLAAEFADSWLLAGYESVSLRRIYPKLVAAVEFIRAMRSR